MRKGVLADDGLVELHGEARNSGNTARDIHDLGAVDLGLERHDVIAHFQRHHDLFQRGVARAFAQAVDRTFDLARARFDGGKAVGRRHAKVVVTMSGKDDLVRAGDIFQELADQIGAFARRGIADGIGDVDRGRPRLDRDFDDTVEVIKLGPRGVHRRPLHIVAQVARVGHRFVDALGHFVHREVRNGAVQRRGADKCVNAGLGRVFDRLVATINVAELGAGQTADDRVLRQLRDFADGGEIPFGGDRETGLDNVDAHLVQQARDLDLFGVGHGGTGGLFAIAQCRVENQDAVLLCGICHRLGSFILLSKSVARGTSL